jgi:hypothetical protein
MVYDKQALMQLGKTAASRFLEDKTLLSDSILKLAATHRLTRNQVERVCHYANHSVNKAMMDKHAYTEFPLARVEDVAGSEKSASFFVVDHYEAPEEDLAKMASSAEPSAQLFGEIAAAYGASFHESGNNELDALALIKAAEVVVNNALSEMENNQNASDAAVESLYAGVRQALLSGVPASTVATELLRREKGHLLERVLNRLEAEGLVRPSVHEDSGPYSLQRFYKRASAEDYAAIGIRYELADDAPIIRAADRITGHYKQAALDAFAAEMALTCLERVDDIYDGLSEHTKKAAAGALGRALSVGAKAGTMGASAVGKVLRPVQRMGQWALDKNPLGRIFGVMGAAGSAGKAGSQMAQRFQAPRNIA